MKNCILTTAIIVFGFSLKLQAATFLPYFNPVRTELVTQLGIATNAAPQDKKLVSALKKPLSMIDKPGTANLAGDLKLLSSLAPALKKLTVGPAFDASLNQTVDSYLVAMISAANTSSNKLASAPASGLKTAAQNNLNQVLNTLAQADSTTDSAAAAKLLSQALGKLVTTDKLIDKATKVTPPKPSGSGVNATISGATSWTYKSTGAAAVPVSPGNINVNSAQAITSAPYGSRGLLFGLYNLKDGANTLTATHDNFAITEVYGNGVHGSYHAVSGSIQVNYNSTAKTVSGSFDVILAEDSSGGQIHAVGTLSLNY